MISRRHLNSGSELRLFFYRDDSKAEIYHLVQYCDVAVEHDLSVSHGVNEATNDQLIRGDNCERAALDVFDRVKCFYNRMRIHLILG